MEYVKQHDVWNVLKKSLDLKEGIVKVFKEGEVWWVSLGVNIGDEEDGKRDKFLRPVLIIRKFNNKLFLGVALTSKYKTGIHYYTIKIKGNRSVIISSQLRTLSAKRLLKRFFVVRDDELIKARKVLKKYLFCPSLSRRNGG